MTLIINFVRSRGINTCCPLGALNKIKVDSSVEEINSVNKEPIDSIPPEYKFTARTGMAHCGMQPRSPAKKGFREICIFLD